MKQCTNCGVELEENANYCSLCGTLLPDKSHELQPLEKTESAIREEKLYSDYQRFTPFQKRKMFWSISIFILISGIVISLLVDLVGNQAITWSKYPITVSMILFFNISLNTFLRKHIPLLLALSFLSVAGLFVLFGLYTGINGWDMKLGLPLLLATYLTFFLLISLIRRSKQKGLNVIAWTLIVAGFLCVYTEGMISIFLQKTLSFGWSLIVLVSVAIISSLLLYIHYRLKKATDLKRFFHI